MQSETESVVYIPVGSTTSNTVPFLPLFSVKTFFVVNPEPLTKNNFYAPLSAFTLATAGPA